MLYVYEFELFEEDDYILAFPFDFIGGTQGINYAEASAMAADWLRTEIEQRLMRSEPIPEATLGNEPQNHGRILLVAVEVNLKDINTVSAKDAANLLGISKSRVSQMLKSGQLAGYREGRDTFVTLDSIKARIASSPSAGRPKANSC